MKVVLNIKKRVRRCPGVMSLCQCQYEAGQWLPQAEDETDFQRPFSDHLSAFVDLASLDDAGAVLSALDPTAQPAAPATSTVDSDSGATRALVDGALLNDIVTPHAR